MSVFLGLMVFPWSLKVGPRCSVLLEGELQRDQRTKDVA